jgi:mannitol-specific phosphotransferase system IIBC component
MFVLMFWGLLALGFNPFFAAVIAAAISFAISLVFLDKQRKQMSEQVHQKLARDTTGTYKDAESDLENEILDSEAKADDKKSDTDK